LSTIFPEIYNFLSGSFICLLDNISIQYIPDYFVFFCHHDFILCSTLSLPDPCRHRDRFIRVYPCPCAEPVPAIAGKSTCSTKTLDPANKPQDDFASAKTTLVIIQLVRLLRLWRRPHKGASHPFSGHWQKDWPVIARSITA